MEKYIKCRSFFQVIVKVINCPPSFSIIPELPLGPFFQILYIVLSVGVEPTRLSAQYSKYCVSTIFQPREHVSLITQFLTLRLGLSSPSGQAIPGFSLDKFWTFRDQGGSRTHDKVLCRHLPIRSAS